MSLLQVLMRFIKNWTLIQLFLSLKLSFFNRIYIRKSENSIIFKKPRFKE